jgi:hypothetical protein
MPEARRPQGVHPLATFLRRRVRHSRPRARAWATLADPPYVRSLPVPRIWHTKPSLHDQALNVKHLHLEISASSRFVPSSHASRTLHAWKSSSTMPTGTRSQDLTQWWRKGRQRVSGTLRHISYASIRMRTNCSSCSRSSWFPDPRWSPSVLTQRKTLRTYTDPTRPRPLAFGAVPLRSTEMISGNFVFARRLGACPFFNSQSTALTLVVDRLPLHSALRIMGELRGPRIPEPHVETMRRIPNMAVTMFELEGTSTSHPSEYAQNRVLLQEITDAASMDFWLVFSSSSHLEALITLIFCGR